MYNKANHSDLSYELANQLHNTILDGFYPTWEDLHAAVSIPAQPNFSLVIWGEEKEGEQKYFSVSLQQGSGEYEKELFTAYVPQDNGYESVLDAADKILVYLERSLQVPLQPLHPGGMYKGYSKEIMQPLLDALNQDDFELAAKLTPAKYRLCGYQEFTEDFLHSQRGFGWAGQFSDTLVSAGRYPVFANRYSYHEADGQWTNELKDFQGLYVYLAGSCVADSENRKPEDYPYENTVWESPYCHAVAKNILENKSSICLLPPYKAEPIHFVDHRGECRTTYRIIDTSLPERMKHRPSDLRKQGYDIYKTKDLTDPARKLYDLFVREYAYSAPGLYGANLALTALSNRKEYTKEGLQELLDKGLLQQRERDGISFELTPRERLHLILTDQINSIENNGLKWEEEIQKCQKEIVQKQSLAERILEANQKSMTGHQSQVNQKNNIHQPEL